MAYLSIFYIAIVFMFSFGYRQNQPHALIKLYSIHSAKLEHLLLTDRIHVCSQNYTVYYKTYRNTPILTSDNQFGFERQHGTDLSIFTVKSVIKYITCVMHRHYHNILISIHKLR